MTVKTLGVLLGDWLKGEHDLNYTREVVTIAQSGTARTVQTGTVLGRITVATPASETHAGNTGNGVMGAITVGDGAVPGVYTLTVIKAGSNVGDFVVLDPNGNVVGYGTVGVAFASGGLSFTLADGDQDFIVGDKFLITVAAGSGKVREIDFSGTLGTQEAYGIAVTTTDVAAAADAEGVALVRGPAVIIAEPLTWPAGATSPQKTAALAQLAAKGIIVRTAA